MEQREFEILTRKIGPKLRATVRHFALASGIETDDVVQETLVALWEMAAEDYPMKDAEALAIRIAKNICISHYRKTHMATMPLEHDNYLGGTEATVLTDREDIAAIRRAVYTSLTKTQREYLHLRNDEGMTLEEIAEHTGRPKTSIKSTLSAARKQMLDLLKKQL